jgi:hypothetical protein
MGNCPPKPNNNAHATSIESSKQVGDHTAKGYVALATQGFAKRNLLFKIVWWMQ